jgi:hypothetical protein
VRRYADSLAKQGRKYFFFEKKKQKTFVRSVKRPARPKRQKFFGSFFQKRTASLLRQWLNGSVLANGRPSAVIAICGIAPVGMMLEEPSD